MDIIEAFILGIVQGLTEFLPVSSSGHLLLVGKLMQAEVSLGFELSCHMGSLLAVVITLRREVQGVLKKPFGALSRHIMLATVPTVIIALLIKKFCPSLLGDACLPVTFLLTAIVLMLGSFFSGTGIINAKTATIIGLVQGFSVLPGLSRSGLTITSAKILGVSESKAVAFSFLISLPIIIGGSVLELASGGIALNASVFSGFIASFLSGLLALTVIKSISLNKLFPPFAVYLTLLSVALTLCN